jgi:hypothetical protein
MGEWRRANGRRPHWPFATHNSPIISMRNLSEREKLTMTHFDIFKKKNQSASQFQTVAA